MNQNSVWKKGGDRWSVMQLVPSVDSSALASLSSSTRSCIEKPIDATGTLARRLSTRRAIALETCLSLNSNVSSKTLRPGWVTDGIDLNRSQVHS